jgi:hypothetical protein
MAAASLSSTQNQKRNYDPFDNILRLLRKAAEFKNLFSELSPSPQRIPISTSFYTTCNPLFNAFSNPAYSQPFRSNNEYEVVGYRGYTCESCLINHPLAIYARKQSELDQQFQLQQGQTITVKHGCNPQRLRIRNSLPTKIRNKIIADLQYELPECIMKAVNDWTNRYPCLHSIEIPYHLLNGYPIDLFPNHESHWSTRATENRQIAFNNAEELKEFICSANNATLGIFNVHSLPQQKDFKSAYLLFVGPIGAQAHI